MGMRACYILFRYPTTRIAVLRQAASLRIRRAAERDQMKLIVSFIVLWVVILGFVLNSCEYASPVANGADEPVSGVVVSGKWYQLSR